MNMGPSVYSTINRGYNRSEHINYLHEISQARHITVLEQMCYVHLILFYPGLGKGLHWEGP